jgi:hypothetical protein
MLFKHLVCAALALTLALPAGVAQASADPSEAAMQSIRPEAIRSHMNFLADDLLEGRGTDSRGYDPGFRASRMGCPRFLWRATTPKKCKQGAASEGGPRFVYRIV